MNERKSSINLIGISEEVNKENRTDEWKTIIQENFPKLKNDLKPHIGKCSWEYQSWTNNTKIYSNKLRWVKSFGHLDTESDLWGKEN